MGFKSVAVNQQKTQPLYKLFEVVDKQADIEKNKENQYPVGFRVHPLLAIEHFIAERNTNNLDNYPRYELFMDHFGSQTDEIYPLNPQLLNIRDVDVPNYEDINALITNTVEYWRTEFSVKKLNDIDLSEWEHQVAEALTQMDQRKLHPDLLAVVCKLVPFYQSNMQILKLAEIFASVDTSKVEPWGETLENNELKFIHRERIQTRHNNGCFAYFFCTENNEVVRVVANRRDLHTAIDTILRLNRNKIKLDIHVKPRTMYSNNFTYWVAHRIDGVSA